MKLDKLRYSLTKHIEKYLFTTDNYKLLIHSTQQNLKKNYIIKVNF